METRAIRSLTVSVVGIGCNNFGRRIDEAASRAVVDAALDEGITLFDTADTYGVGQSEEFLGRALGPRARRRGHRDEVRHGRRHQAAEGRERGVDRDGASKEACDGWGPTASTCTNCTRPTTRLRSTRRSKRSTDS